MGGRIGKELGEKADPAGARKFDAHTNAKAVARMVGEDFWRAAFKFASERHPYEKAVSLAFYKLRRFKREPSEAEIARFIDQTVSAGAYRGFRVYSIDGRPVVDDFIRHENFAADLRRICERVGIACPDELPQRKAKIRADPRPAREILSAAQKRAIFEHCREEFELLGYEP
jgi:hypothetical protein